MRVLLVILLLANAGFAAWAALVDRPVEPPAAHDISGLKRLVLTRELPARPQPAPQPQPSAAAPAAGSLPTAAVLPAEPPHCVSVGPFDDIERAAGAAALLKTRGFMPRQRDEAGTDLVEYWVYLDGFASDAAEQAVLDQLHAKGLDDARAMPSGSQGRRLSLGLFSERARAERRASTARTLGVAPRIAEQHHPKATYWVDLTLASQAQTVSTAGLLPAGGQGDHLTIRSCPPGAESG